MWSSGGDRNRVGLPDYTWLGNALGKRETTCDYPGGSKPKFRTDFERDGLQRVSKVANTHLTSNQADSGYEDLGTWTYSYDSASSPLDETQTGSMAHLDADRAFAYDTPNRLLTGRLGDTQDWDASSEETTWYSYDDLGNRISHQYRDATAIGKRHSETESAVANPTSPGPNPRSPIPNPQSRLSPLATTLARTLSKSTVYEPQ